MISKLSKPINIISILCYLIFMGMTFDSKVVNALVLYISELNSKPVYISGDFNVASVERETTTKRKPIVAIQYKVKQRSNSISSLELSKSKHPNTISDSKKVGEVKGNISLAMNSVSKPIVFKKLALVNDLKPIIVKKIKTHKSKKIEKKKKTLPSAVKYINAIKKLKWSYASVLDRYVVKYNKDTYIVLTIRPGLQKRLENIFKKYKSRISAGIIQDPATGAILAMTSSHKNRTLSVLSNKYKNDNWALKATFPVASIFKIITASAGFENKIITVNSKIRAWRRSYLKVWQAFARSNNAVFGWIGKKAGRKNMKKYAKAFGFNKKFFFDLSVGNAVAKFPKNRKKFGQSCAGLNKFFMVSPMHVASIISTIINGGKTMKPYLVDYVVRDGNIIFSRKPFQIAKPILKSTASKIYRMMHKTTTYGTAKRGFGGYRRCPSLAKMCGGKTGTLTGASPKYLFTWFGGPVKVTGRDLTVVTLMGQQVGRSGKKASSVAGQIAYELYMKRHENSSSMIASK